MNDASFSWFLHGEWSFLSLGKLHCCSTDIVESRNRAIDTPLWCSGSLFIAPMHSSSLGPQRYPWCLIRLEALTMRISIAVLLLSLLSSAAAHDKTWLPTCTVGRASALLILMPASHTTTSEIVSQWLKANSYVNPMLAAFATPGPTSPITSAAVSAPSA